MPVSSPSERAELDVDIFPTPKRLAAIDFDEALAMFFVVLYHSSSYSIDILGDGTAFFRYALNGVLSTCVPMFFLVNGFLLFRKPLNLEKHIRKTLRLAAVTILWGFLIPVVASTMLAEPLSASEYLSYGWHYKTGWNNQLWFMGALVCIYTVFPLLKIAYDSHWTIFLFSVVIATILSFGNTTLNEVASLLMGLLAHEPQLISFDFFGSFDVLRGLHGFSFAYFCIGGLAGRHWEKIQKTPPQTKICVGLVILATNSAVLALWGRYASLAQNTVWDSVWYGYNTLFVLFNTLALFAIGSCYRGINRPLHKLICVVSENTLGILYVHNLVRIALTVAMWNLNISSHLRESFFGSFLFAAIILASSCLVVYWLKKVPWLRNIV